MSRLSLLERYNEKYNEEIQKNKLLNDIKLIKLIIKGKRDVVIVNLNKNLGRILEKRKIGVIPIRLISNDNILSIIYRDKEKAYKVYEIAKSKNGFLSNRDIEKNYKELTEQKIHSNLNKRIIGIAKDSKRNGVKVCSVNGSYVKGNNPGLGFIDFIEGGHHYIDSYPGYKKFIPEDEIWIDDVFLPKRQDFNRILGHKWTERNLIKYKKWNYDKAHEYANKKEIEIRKNRPNKNLNESVQHKRIKNLMKKIQTYLLFTFLF
jgi:hypothetical protein